MWMRTRVEWSGTAALCFGLVLSHLFTEGSVVTVQCRPGEQVNLPCPYHYEDHGHVSQLSVQWRSPNNELLCHYIKHKAFQNCSSGYTIVYTPGNITLTIRQLNTNDFGVHVCSVGKRHEFADSSIEVVRVSGFVTSEPKARGNQLGQTWTLFLLLTLSLIVYL
ncbi:Hepatocyte cell adhesion molecule [Solea senegalensis]|uniref:Hepatocyte cell adhesion molecule n=1 Tax=Solea senegalensis TaxID=28829 RepID=A0AAV6Q812_SOLSE|nr:Hepatocyte cell adhesion molecule [Solea senegalensis]